MSQCIDFERLDKRRIKVGYSDLPGKGNRRDFLVGLGQMGTVT